MILVDGDVDIFDTNDVLWALNTRYQGNLDTLFLPGVRCHPLDPERRAGIPPLDSGPRHILQDDFRLHGAFCAEGAL